MAFLFQPTLSIYPNFESKTATVTVKGNVMLSAQEFEQMNKLKLSFTVSCNLLGVDLAVRQNRLSFSSKIIGGPVTYVLIPYVFKKTGVSFSILDEDTGNAPGVDQLVASVSLVNNLSKAEVAKTESNIYGFTEFAP